MIAIPNYSLSDEKLTRHSLIMVALGVAGGSLNYLYQFFMGLLLNTEQYGVLFSLTSLMTIVIVFSQGLTITVAKFISKLKAEGRRGAIHYLWQRSLLRATAISVLAFALLAASSPLIIQFLNIDRVFYLIVLLCTILFVFALSVNWGIMQGLQQFVCLGITQVLLELLKAGLGVVLVLIGWGIYGGLAAFPIAFSATLIVSFFFLRGLSNEKREHVAAGNVPVYIFFTLLSIISMTLLTNVDVILAKHYLTATEAGNYSAISLLGRVTYYAPVGIAVAMFPKTSALFESRGHYVHLFIRSVVFLMVITGGIVLIYALVPEFVTTVLFRDKYLLVAPHLFTYGLAMALFACCFLLVIFLLSVNQLKVAYPLLGAVIIQIVLLNLFHGSIGQLVNVMLVCGIISVAILLPFYWRVRRWSHQ